MKAYILIVILVVMLSCSAQTELLKREKMNKSDQACLYLLNNGHPAAIEDALFYLLHYDVFNYNKINDQIHDKIKYLAGHGETEKIRYRATIISDYLSSDDKLLRVNIKMEYLDKEKLFELVKNNLKNNNLIVDSKHN